MNIELLLRDAELNNNIQFPHAIAEHWHTPEKVFLTGATGFLGAYLLAELLQQSNAHIYCLVRADNNSAGKQRIRENMQFYDMWQPAFELRIQAVIGDLALPQLGLSAHQFVSLGECIDVIYHNAAQVNAMHSYQRLKACNVSATLDVLRLAGLTRTKPIIYISTQAVFFSDAYLGKNISENDVAQLDAGLKGGYKQSKWVAESLVIAARERGLPTMIFRPGRILGASQTGIIDRLGDLLVSLLLGSVQIQQFPQVNTLINFAPVDYVSQAIVTLGQKTQSLNQNFHVCHPDSISWNDLWEIIAALGYPAKPVEFDHWVASINTQAKTGNDTQLYRMLSYMLRTPIYLFSNKPQFATQQTQMALASSAVRCPVIDKKLMATYFSYFQDNGYLPLTKPTINC